MAQIYESTNKTGIVDRVYWETGSDTTTYPLGIMFGHINDGLGDVIREILKVDKRWKWDDANITKSLETVFSLSENVGEYGILAATPAETYQDFNKLFGVSVKDSAGTWIDLTYISREDVRKLGIAWDDFETTPGTPKYYTPEGTQLLIKPSPDYNSSAGAKLFVQRNPVYFAITDTTKVPPFDSKYHHILSYYGRKGWALKNELNAVPLIESLIDKTLKKISLEYAMRLEAVSPNYINANWK